MFTPPGAKGPGVILMEPRTEISTGNAVLSGNANSSTSSTHTAFRPTAAGDPGSDHEYNGELSRLSGRPGSRTELPCLDPK